MCVEIAWRGLAMWLQDASHICLRKIVADKEQTTGMFHCDLICKAVAKIQTSRVQAPAPTLISLRNAPRTGRRDRDDFQTKTLDETSHLLVNVPSTRNNEGFRHSAGRYQDFGLGFQDSDARISTRFSQDNRHKRRRIDGYHLGSPSPS
jgi:hypothetical protein